MKTIDTLEMINNTLTKRKQRVKRLQRKQVAEEVMRFKNPCRYCLTEIPEGMHFCSDDHFGKFIVIITTFEDSKK